MRCDWTVSLLLENGFCLDVEVDHLGYTHGTESSSQSVHALELDKSEAYCCHFGSARVWS